MKTLMVNIKNEKDTELIMALLSKFNVEVVENKTIKAQLPESKFKSPGELRAMRGILKGQLMSKEHLRNLSWKNRSY